MNNFLIICGKKGKKFFICFAKKYNAQYIMRNYQKSNFTHKILCVKRIPEKRCKEIMAEVRERVKELEKYLG